MAVTHRLIFYIISFISTFHDSSTLRDLDWWETTLMYQIYPRSFKDSNGDGIGDFNGIYEKLDYLEDLGIETIWIQPFYTSPNADMGYDVANYKMIDPMFGTMDDFKKLVKGIHDRGMKVILDYVPNHTSDESEWFKLSENQVKPYTDYYVWKDPKRFNETSRTYPNNWASIFEDSAWTWSEKREQYYYHVFGKKQPDLNYRNPNVRREMINVLKYWLDLGVDGFRVDAVLWLLENETFMDEPVIPRAKGPPRYNTLRHIYTENQPENFALIHEWRLALEQYKAMDGQTRLLSVETVGGPKEIAKYFGNSTHPNAHFPFFLLFNYATYQANASIFDFGIRKWMATVPEDRLPNWVLDSHDVRRTSTRFSPDSVDSVNMAVLLLPGLACVFYGTEIGLEDGHIRKDQQKDNNIDPYTQKSRDCSRTPMLWDNTKNAGFTTNETAWLPVQTNYWRKNVKRQEEESNSHLKVFKRLVSLRKTPVIKHGHMKSYVLSNWVYMFTRSLGDNLIAVVLNLGSETKQFCAKNAAPELPDFMFVHTSSINSRYEIGDKVRVSDSGGQNCAELEPNAGLVLSINSSIVCSLSPCLAILALGINLFWNMRSIK